MPRPPRVRRVGFVPRFRNFMPISEANETPGTSVVLTIDELEALRLTDLQGMDQEEAAVAMDVARTTYQRILNGAHYKVAQALVLGSPLVIEGGTYRVVPGSGCHPCEQDGTHADGECLSCHRHRHGRGGRRER